MISVANARKILGELVIPQKQAELPLAYALGLACAENIATPYHIPGFVQSSMDGYDFSYQSWLEHHPLQVVTTIQAGTLPPPKLEPNQAMTGNRHDE